MNNTASAESATQTPAPTTPLALQILTAVSPIAVALIGAVALIITTHQPEPASPPQEPTVTCQQVQVCQPTIIVTK